MFGSAAWPFPPAVVGVVNDWGAGGRLTAACGTVAALTGVVTSGAPEL